MKVKNASKRVIKLLNGKEKVTLIPGSDTVYDVTYCPDVQAYLDSNDLVEVVGRRRSTPEDGSSGDGERPMTVPQLKKALAAKNITVPDGVTERDDLKALLDASDE